MNIFKILKEEQMRIKGEKNQILFIVKSYLDTNRHKIIEKEQLVYSIQKQAKEILYF